MKTYTYEGIDKNGRLVRGSTAGTDERQVKAQLAEFGFKNIRVEQQVASESYGARASGDYAEEPMGSDFGYGEPVEEEEADEDEWKRADALARAYRFRRRENIALIISLILVGAVAAYLVYDKMTEMPAPQPEILVNSSSGMLSLKDVRLQDGNLVFVVYSRNWNGNVRVDFQAWDAFDNRIDFGTARVGFVGEYYGGSPERSGAIKLKKSRFYERIEILVSGDEDR